MKTNANEGEVLANLETMLRSGLVGQERAIASVASLVVRGELGFSEKGRPRGSFLFLGPSGVGKTQLAKDFTRLIGGGIEILDMSEFSRPTAVADLLGTHRSEGRLATLLASSPKTILFDEIEKAHSGVRDLCLQVLDEGRLTLRGGKVLRFDGSYVVFTSNLGSDAILKAQRGMSSSLSRFVRDRAMAFFRPETFGRIDLVEVFNPLTFAHRVEIGSKIAVDEVARLRALGFPAENVVGDTLLAMCAKDCELGVRPLRRRIQSIIQEALVTKVLDAEAA